MTSTQLNLETVTPMFLRGYDNRTLELRPPPFKALFRYWWRTVQDCDWKSLQEAEGDLFGSTKGKAPFSIRIPGTTNLNPTQYKALPHKPDNDRRSIMDAYEGGQSFDLCLITKSESDACLCKQIAKLGFLLGGVGNRSRRGFGSIRETSWNFPDVSDLREAILETLNAVAKADRFQINNQFQINGRSIEIIESKRLTRPHPQYPVIRRIFFGKLTGDVDNLLKKIGRATSVAKRNNKDNTLGDGRPRMASPIVVRIQMVGSQYIPVVTQLYSIYPGHPPIDIRGKQAKFINDIIT
jgi:CRISPR-associated protein Cmr1